MRFSIVIPTMTYSLVKKCIESIIEFTNLDDVEIIVVANGADPKLQDYISDLSITQSIPIKCIWFDEPLGAVIALNEGINAATGEYVLLLNDDCQLLPAPKHYWIESLLEPFTDQQMGCTGPFKMDSGMNKLLNPNVDREFIIFFCAMIPNKLFKELGILDDTLKCGVDIDFCIRLGQAGYKIKQIPDTKLQHSDINSKLLVGDFPIYHQGEGTVHDHYGFETWQKIIQEDIDLLNAKYAVTEDTTPKGFFTDWDATWYRTLVDGLPDGSVFAEVGCLEGKSLCSVADIIIRKDLKVFAVDLFDDFYDPLFKIKFDNQLANFSNNISQHGISDHVHILKGPSVEMAKLVKISSLDMVFLDADHTTESVTNDLNAWYQKVKPGGIIAGHDFEWETVKTALNNVIGMEHIFQDYNATLSSNCWFTVKPRVFDGFMFFNELDVLEMRLAETYDVVTKFIIIEGARKINGQPNEMMYFTNNKDRYAKYMDKIIHVVVDVFPENLNNDPWEFERHLRDSIAAQWTGLNDRDVVLVSDCDEIPRASVVANYKLKDDFSSLVQRLYYDYLNNYSGNWEWVKILPYYIARSMSPCQIRYTEAWNKIQDAGWHFTFIGGAEKIREKITSYAHQEYNKAEYLDSIETAIANGDDIFKRPGVTKTAVPIDFSFPKTVQDNLELYKSKGYVRPVRQKILPIGKDVLCSMCTKNRYDSTLGLAIQSICMQTVKPAALLIYDDNTDADRRDLRANETYGYLFEMLDFSGIKWEIIFGAQKGQHYGHQAANKKGYKYVWRIDDDEVAAPDVLEKLLRHMDEDVGAVGGVVLTRGCGGEGSGKMEHIYNYPNVQWTVSNDVLEVDHLHSTFLYRANIVDYNLELSPVAHREETIFSHELKLKGYRLLVDRSAITHHLKQQSTGIRSHSSVWFYEHDERLFSKKMESWGYKLINLDSGLGDHYAFLNILPKLKKRWKHVIIGACFPEVFSDHTDITLIHIFQSNPINNENIYKWMWDNNWKTSIVDAYATYYGVNQ